MPRAKAENTRLGVLDVDVPEGGVAEGEAAHTHVLRSEMSGQEKQTSLESQGPPLVISMCASVFVSVAQRTQK